MTSTVDIPQTVLDKIQGLLNMTEANGCSEAEAANAAAAASALMLKHRIERAELDKDEKPELIEVIIDFGFKRTTSWKFHLLGQIARLNGCFIVFDSQRLGNSGAYSAYGRSENIVIVRWLYKYLVENIERLAKEQKPGGMSRGEGKRWNNSFKLGASDRISNRLQEEHDREKQRNVSETALVKVESEFDEAKYFATQLCGKLTFTNKTHCVDMNAYEKGQQAGNKVSLNKPLQS